MSQFLSGGVECGPTTALKDVSTRIDRDYGIQRDRFVPAGPSTSRPPRLGQQQIQPPAISAPSPAFDLSAFRAHLPPQASSVLSHPTANTAPIRWSEGFSSVSSTPPLLGKGKARAEPSSWGGEFERSQQRGNGEQQRAASDWASSRQWDARNGAPMTMAPWERPTVFASPAPNYAHIGPAFQPVHSLQTPFALPYPPQGPINRPLDQLYPNSPQITNHVEPRTLPATLDAETGRPQPPSASPQDTLARTAQALVDSISTENLASTNPKLAQSQFFRLLRGLGEGSVVVEEPENATSTTIQPATSQSEEVGPGARFVQRSGADWATDFLGTSSSTSGISMSSSGTLAEVRQSSALRPSQSPVHELPATNSRLFRTYEAHAPAMSPSLKQNPTAWAEQFQEALVMNGDPVGSVSQRKSVHFDHPEPLGAGVPRDLNSALAASTAIPGAGVTWDDPGLTDLDDFDEEALLHYSGEPRIASAPSISAENHEGWGQLQREWETLDDAVQSGTLRGQGVDDRYMFHSSNPYAGAELVRELSPTTMGVLELEAAVQQNPTDASAWLALGLKQQENERENDAILALSKAVQLDPDNRATYLALAVSYTNENEYEAANTMLERWIELAESHNGEQSSQMPVDDSRERKRRIIDRLIDIARQKPDDVDVDVQIALGVLFNSTEDYEKAEDCFVSALNVRPDDWVLYNRLGATLANSGRSQEAIKYYHRALTLHPNFVRAQFNLGIAYNGLAQYRMAAQCILDAIRLQHSDATEGHGNGSGARRPGVKGVTSDALWATLRTTCMHMDRHDLVHLATIKDLSAFPLEIQVE